MATAASLATVMANSRSGSGGFLVRSPSTRDCFEPEVPDAICVTIVVLGASGDLAKKKTYPALFQLHSKGFLPRNVQIVGYARTAMSNEDLRKKIRGFLKGPDDKIEDFLKTMTYLSGQYDGDEGFMKLQQVLNDREVRYDGAPNGRLYYLALPPSVYPQVCTGLKKHCSVVTQKDNSKSFLRIVIEKPFGHDFDSSEKLSEQLGLLFEEEQMYRIDHYLGKELTQNLMVMRFGNSFFECWWNRQYISNIQVTFKENFGVEGRGGYFDEFGIIRDVIQNHLLQLLTLVAMEKPISTHPDDIRDEKLKVLRCIDPVPVTDCVIGQYAGDRDHLGYLQDKTVPPNSKTPTFASCVLYIRNGRWDGVPFILKAGKALNERKSEIRIQLKDPPAALYTTENSRNEFVIRLQPSEAIYMKMMVKKPGEALENWTEIVIGVISAGLESDAEMSELDLSYDQRYKDANIPDAYERLILDVIRGDQQHFVRRDELAAAWKIFTPLLEKIDKGMITPETYFYGSRGPKAADELLARVGYERSSNYLWKKE